MLTVNVKLSVDDIITSLDHLDADEREKLQLVLFNLSEDSELINAIAEIREDVKAGRTYAHEDVMKEIKEKYYR